MSREIAPSSNKRVNLSVQPVTGLANGARPAPVCPAGYAQRYAADKSYTYATTDL
jgi:hypothetical protein